MTRTEPTKEQVDVIGTTYHADWTASSSASTSAQLTGSITLPPGTYVLTLNVPETSGTQPWVGLPMFNRWLGNFTSPTCLSCIVTLTETKEVYAQAGTGRSLSYSNLQYGSLDAVRIA